MAESATRFVIVLTTAGSEEQAVKLARELVQRRLAACTNIVSQIHSVYRWKGKICQDEEKLLVIKTAAHLFPAVSEAIRELHTYELPEVVMLPITPASPEIAAWLESCLSQQGEEEEEGGPVELNPVKDPG